MTRLGASGVLPSPPGTVLSLPALRARRAALEAERDGLRQRVAARRAALADVLTTAAAIRDAAEAVRAEGRVLREAARAPRLESVDEALADRRRLRRPGRAHEQFGGF